MGKKIDRTGEKGVNNFGSEMVIVEYRKAIDIDVYFPEYNWTFKHGRYNAFKRGNIKCLKMVSLKKNIRFGIICYKDVMILNIKRGSQLIKGVL